MRMWVFGYGSLVWNPGFDVADRAIARLPDYHRSFCMRSIHHRGTDADPGLVLALDATPGAQCHGLALRAHDDQADDVLAYLRERELVSAERQTQNLFAAVFMRDRLGDRFDGTITGLSQNGVFVQIDAPFVDGMVTVGDIETDRREP